MRDRMAEYPDADLFVYAIFPKAGGNAIVAPMYRDARTLPVRLAEQARRRNGANVMSPRQQRAKRTGLSWPTRSRRETARSDQQLTNSSSVK